MSVPRWLAGLALLALLAAGGCSDDDDDAGGADPPVSLAPSTTAEPAPGGLDIPEIPGTFPAPLPGLGFGIAVPEGWQATLLSEEALERLADAALARPSFLEAARTVASTGAVFYAAGVDDDERVAELKVDVQDGADTDPQAVLAVAQAVADRGDVGAASVIGDPAADGRVRVDYRVDLPSAEDGETISAYGTQLFVVDGDRLWSLIITSEDEATQSALLGIFGSSITFD